MDRRLILIELNEINFDIVERYASADPSRFPAFRKLLAGPSVRTASESSYELLEPWIQWVSVHTGLSYEQHRVLRLGDMADRNIPQLFEALEDAGITVGAISPMNAANRLKRAAYFIPDPWTRTPSDQSWWSRALTSAVSQAVNDNSQARITPASAVKLLLGLVRYARPRNYFTYLRLALSSRRRPWRKALFLDLFLHDLHLRRANACKPGFSALFLNAGAHIQHHYFLNSRVVSDAVSIRNPAWYVSPDEDPVADMLETYDRIVGDYVERSRSDLIIATGLSQRPYDRVKFYYRLRDHAGFLRMIGVGFKEVVPRMTRDFLITFEDAGRALEAQALLAGLKERGTGKGLFGEIDNRGDDLFVTLTFPEEIKEDAEFEVGDRRFRLAPHVAFVAIKNGMHDAKGFAFFTGRAGEVAPPDEAHVKELHSSILRYFDLSSGVAQARETK